MKGSGIMTASKEELDEALEDFKYMLNFIELCNQGYGTVTNDFIKQSSINTIRNCLQEKLISLNIEKITLTEDELINFYKKLDEPAKENVKLEKLLNEPDYKTLAEKLLNSMSRIQQIAVQYENPACIIEARNAIIEYKQAIGEK